MDQEIPVRLSLWESMLETRKGFWICCQATLEPSLGLEDPPLSTNLLMGGLRERSVELTLDVRLERGPSRERMECWELIEVKGHVEDAASLLDRTPSQSGPLSMAKEALDLVDEELNFIIDGRWQLPRHLLRCFLRSLL